MKEELKRINKFLNSNLNLINKLNLNSSKPNTLNCNKDILLQLILLSNNIFDSISELIYIIRNKNNLENLHIFCPVCGKKNNFINYSRGFTKHCSSICYFNNMKDAIKKLKQTKKERYGDENFVNIEKNKQTCLKKYGVDNYSKTKQGRLNASINLHTLKANKNREQTFLKHFGCCHPWKNKDFIKNNQLIIFNKYGKKSFSQTDKFKNLWNDKKFIENRQNKQYITKKNNNTFNTSKQENKIYLKLKLKFPNVIHQYKDNKRYPFICDFYIPSKDLFIELNFHWTHGGEPFNKDNNQCIEKLNNWQEKSINSKFYKNALYCWTDLDVRKLEIFKKNNLNYKIFYNEKEFEDWFNGYTR